MIAIVYNQILKPETELPVQEAVTHIEKAGHTVVVNPKDFKRDINAVVVYGGDGLLLHTANRVAQHKKPLLGINYGKVGYLCKVQPKDHLTAIDRILDNSFKLEKRARIQARINFKKTIDALNEISIGGINRTVSLNMTTDMLQVKRLVAIGDGIMFATSTGSTAYNVNAGGSVLLSDDVMSIVANNSIFQSDTLPVNTKSLVVPLSTINRIHIGILNKNKNNIPFIVADGQRTIKLKKDDVIEIARSIYNTFFVTFD